MCTGTIRWAGACPVNDLAPRRPKSRRLLWRDWVTPSALVRLLSRVVCSDVTDDLATLCHVSTSRDRVDDVTGAKLEPACDLSSSSLPSPSLSRWQTIHRRSPPPSNAWKSATEKTHSYHMGKEEFVDRTSRVYQSTERIYTYPA
jgi:hypothetical protein